MPKIKARVVLHQTPIELQYFTGARNHGEACHPFTRHAVANHIDTTCIGGNVAANLTRAAGRKIDGIEKPASLAAAWIACVIAPAPT